MWFLVMFLLSLIGNAFATAELYNIGQGNAGRAAFWALFNSSFAFLVTYLIVVETQPLLIIPYVAGNVLATWMVLSKRRK
jgi:hypothetical protein